MRKFRCTIAPQNLRDALNLRNDEADRAPADCTRATRVPAGTTAIRRPAPGRPRTYLESWTRPQPSGIRVSDAVAWARGILARYGAAPDIAGETDPMEAVAGQQNAPGG